MICKKCGAENANDNLFCMTCGEKLEAPAEEPESIAFCPYCGSKLNEDGAFCPACGRQVISDAAEGVVCPKCGAALETPVEFCPFCGAKTVEISADEVKTESAPNIKGRKCPKCKTPIPDDTSICPQCGTDFESFGSKDAAAAFGLAVFLPLAGLIYAVMGLKKYKTPATRNKLVAAIVFSVVMWIVWLVINAAINS